MLERIWRVPGWALVLVCFAWAMAVGYASPPLDPDFVARLATAPIFAWLVLCGHELRGLGRFWWRGHATALVSGLFILFVVIGTPETLNEQGEVAEITFWSLAIPVLVLVLLVAVCDHIAKGVRAGESEFDIRSEWHIVAIVLLISPFLNVLLYHSYIGDLRIALADKLSHGSRIAT